MLIPQCLRHGMCFLFESHGCLIPAAKPAPTYRWPLVNKRWPGSIGKNIEKISRGNVIRPCLCVRSIMIPYCIHIECLSSFLGHSYSVASYPLRYRQRLRRPPAIPDPGSLSDWYSENTIDSGSHGRPQAHPQPRKLGSPFKEGAMFVALIRLYQGLESRLPL